MIVRNLRPVFLTFWKPAWQVESLGGGQARRCCVVSNLSPPSPALIGHLTPRAFCTNCYIAPGLVLLARAGLTWRETALIQPRLVFLLLSLQICSLFSHVEFTYLDTWFRKLDVSKLVQNSIWSSFEGYVDSVIIVAAICGYRLARR